VVSELLSVLVSCVAFPLGLVVDVSYIGYAYRTAGNCHVLNRINQSHEKRCHQLNT
jgi:hypothetical protein